MFGAVAYTKVPDEKRLKLDPKAKPAMFVGYAYNQYGYLLYNYETKKLFTAKNVYVDDDTMYFANRSEEYPIRESQEGDTLLVGKNEKPGQDNKSEDLDEEKEIIVIEDSSNSPIQEILRESKYDSELEEGEVEATSSSSEKEFIPKSKEQVQRRFTNSDLYIQPNMRYEVEVDEKGRRKVAEAAERRSREKEAEAAAAEGLRRFYRVTVPSPEGLVSVSQALERKSSKTKRKLNVFKMEDLIEKYKYVNTSREDYKDPQNVEEALNSPLAEFWKEAMLEELSSLQEKRTWEEVPRAQADKVVKTKWVFKRKMHGDGTLDKFKARFVAKGFSQTPGIDVNETYASIMRHSTWRTLLVFAVNKDYKIYHWDIKTAFLNAELKETVYIEPPEYIYGSKRDVVLKLKKGLYGLQQAPREWQLELHKHLDHEGFRQGRADKSLFTLNTLRKGFEAAIGIWVDDMFAVVKPGLETSVREKISRKFKLEDRGEVSEFLGIQFRKTSNNEFFILQSHYVQQMLRKYNTEDANPNPTPMIKGLKLSMDQCPKDEAEKNRMIRVPYQSAVGTLMYLAVCTRPDILYAVTVVARFMHNPGEVHWTAVKRIFRYLRGTINYGIWFRKPRGGPPGLTLEAYSDASWASDDVDTYKSNSGYVTMVNGIPVSWRSIKKSSIAQSSTEAEYAAGCITSIEVCWLRNLLGDIRASQRHPTIIYQDNQACIKIATDSEGHREASKHFIIRYHKFEENIKLGFVVPVYLATGNMIADIFTKALERVLHVRHRDNVISEIVYDPA